MKKKLNLIILSFFLIQFPAFAQFVTFTRQSHGTNSIAVPAGETWQIHSWSSENNLGYSNFTIRLGTNAVDFNLKGTGGYFYSLDNAGTGSLSIPIGFLIPGPATLENVSPIYGFIAIFKKIPHVGSAENISATSVVIPSSATGDVDVKLEQSADNVTWTECLPGTYNSSTVKRFFRLRAVEK